MALTAFGKAVRKARIDANETLVSMATAIGTSPAYLSGMETGRKKISVEWAVKITNFFRSRNVWVKDLQELAYISNNAVPVKGLPLQQQILVAKFARHTITDRQLKKFEELLKEIL